MRLCLFILGGFLSLSCAAFAQGGKSIKKQALKYIRNHDPEGYDIIQAYYKAPDSFEFEKISIDMDSHIDYGVYIDSSSHRHFLASLNTVVHEISHAYTHHTVFKHIQKEDMDFEWGNQYSLFYLNKDEQLLVQHTPTFPSSKLHGFLPDSLISSRYHTYIYPSAQITTQTIGIYGLLDEWHAYYHGTKNSVNLRSYYDGYARGNHERWVDYFTAVHGTYLAYPEFKLYIMEYLVEAEKNEPAMFQEIMTNEPFKRSITQVDSLFGALIEDFRTQKRKILQDLMMKGVNCGEDEEFVFMGTKGYSNFVVIYEKLEKEIEKPAYKEIWARLRE